MSDLCFKLLKIQTGTLLKRTVASTGFFSSVGQNECGQKSLYQWLQNPLISVLCQHQGLAQARTSFLFGAPESWEFLLDFLKNVSPPETFISSIRSASCLSQVYCYTSLKSSALVCFTVIKSVNRCFQASLCSKPRFLITCQATVLWHEYDEPMTQFICYWKIFIWQDVAAWNL